MKIYLSVTPAKAGAHADKHNLVREWMPARLRRTSGLRGQDLEMDFFDSLLRFPLFRGRTMKYLAPLALCILFNFSALRAERTIVINKIIGTNLLQTDSGRLNSFAGVETISIHGQDSLKAQFVAKVFTKAIKMLQKQPCEGESYSVHIVLGTIFKTFKT